MSGTIWGPSETTVHLLIRPEIAAALVEATEWALSEWDGLPSYVETTAKWREAASEVRDILNGPPPVLFQSRAD